MNERPFKFGLAVAVLVTIVLCIIMWVQLTHQHQQLSRSQTATCQQVEALKTVVRQVIRQGEDALGKRGTAGYAYYHVHQQELASARRQASMELAEFSPHHCS